MHKTSKEAMQKRLFITLFKVLAITTVLMNPFRTQAYTIRFCTLPTNSPKYPNPAFGRGGLVVALPPGTSTGSPLSQLVGPNQTLNIDTTFTSRVPSLIPSLPYNLIMAADFINRLAIPGYMCNGIYGIQPGSAYVWFQQEPNGYVSLNRTLIGNYGAETASNDCNSQTFQKVLSNPALIETKQIINNPSITPSLCQ